jgi:deoxycytidine triphosphate deaminase
MQLDNQSLREAIRLRVIEIEPQPNLATRAESENGALSTDAINLTLDDWVKVPPSGLEVDAVSGKVLGPCNWRPDNVVRWLAWRRHQAQFIKERGGHLDNSLVDFTDAWPEYQIEPGGFFRLKPWQFIHMRTAERLTLRRDPAPEDGHPVSGRATGRSRTARAGIFTDTSSDTMHNGTERSKFVLEVLNVTGNTYRLHPGMSLVQMTFHELKDIALPDGTRVHLVDGMMNGCATC